MYLDVSVDNGKYTVKIDKGGGLYALRYGEEWRDCCGDNLIFHLAYELQETRKELEKIKNGLNDVLTDDVTEADDAGTIQQKIDSARKAIERQPLAMRENLSGRFNVG